MPHQPHVPRENGRFQLTLNLSNGGIDNILLRLFVLEARKDLGNNGLGKVGLLALLLLLLIADPAIKHALQLCRNNHFLLLNERLRFEFSGLLLPKQNQQLLC